jgi:hypothetical protein
MRAAVTLHIIRHRVMTPALRCRIIVGLNRPARALAPTGSIDDDCGKTEPQPIERKQGR